MSNLPNIDAERIGIIGICGFGGFALNAAAIDTRIKATLTSTMYDMSRVNAKGYFDAMGEEERYALKQSLMPSAVWILKTEPMRLKPVCRIS